MSDMTPEQVIAQIDEWRNHEVHCEVLGGAITNHNYLVTVDGEPGSPGVGRFVLRIPGDATDAFIDRECEHRNHVAAATAGVSPPVLHLIQPGYCTVVPFITGETMHPETIAGHPERLRLIVEAVRTYHDRAVFDNEIRIFDMIRDYTRMARNSMLRARTRPSGCSGSGSASSRPCSATSRRPWPATTTCSPRT